MFPEISTEIKNLKPSGVILRTEIDPDHIGKIPEPDKLKNNRVMQTVHKIIVEREKKEGESK